MALFRSFPCLIPAAGIALFPLVRWAGAIDPRYFKRYRLVTLLPCLRPGMCRPIDSVQPCGIAVGVALCRRQAGVAQQLLDGAQITSGTQEMGGEGVAQRMRRHAVGQAKLPADLAHPLLDDSGIERAAACSEKERMIVSE